jgi:FMN-dependent oxidoreductase (nitrilotriacetate monooxygenase family)
MFHMGWFLHYGFGVYGWNSTWAGNLRQDIARPGLYVDMARSLERAGFDYMMLEDASVIPDVYEGSLRKSLKSGVVRHDPMPLVPLLGAVTSRLGIIATASTSFYPPFLAARLFRTLDHLTEGRVGINLVTSSPHAAAQNFGHDQHFEHDLRYEMADEWMELVEALWNSWDPDAVILDEESGYFADPDKVRHVNFEGRFFKSRGPLNTVPSPQQKPVICQAGGSPAGRNLAAKHADTIIATGLGVEAMKEYRDDISRRMIEYGRNPKDAKVLFLVVPVLGDTDAEARLRYETQTEARKADVETIVAGMSSSSGIDFSRFDLDEPLPDLTGMSNGHQSSTANMAKLGEGARTLREVATAYRGSEAIELVGSPDTVAVQMSEAMDYVGGDGFLVANPVTRRNITDICDGLAPALRRRGLIRDGYEHTLFRDNLLAF